MMNSKSSVLAAIIAALISIQTPAASPASKCLKKCVTSTRGYKLIQKFEGYSPFSYKDIAGVPTIGFGHAIKPGERFQEPLIGDAAFNVLKSDVRSTEKGVNREVSFSLEQNQFDALVSFSYNVGVGTLGRSTLLRVLNAGKTDQVPPQFLRYAYAGGRYSKGLAARREQEADLFGE